MKLASSTSKRIKQFIHYARKRKRSEEDYFEFQQFQGKLIIDTLQQYTDLQRKITILDIGSGIGGYVFELAKLPACHIVSLDKNPLKIATDRYKTITKQQTKRTTNKLLKRKANIIFNSKKITVIEGDITQSPLKDESCDIIIASGVIEHVKEQKKMLQECKRILKKDGLLYVSFPPYYSLTGGHAISPLHYLPGKLPFKIYKRLYKNKHKSFRYYGLYKTTIQSIKKMSDEMFHIIDIRPRLFTFLKPLLKVPIINEGISHHIEFILKKK